MPGSTASRRSCRNGDRAGLPSPGLRGPAPFDLIVANILARPLMQLAPEMARYLTPGGSLILSGILERQRNAVIAAYSASTSAMFAPCAREGWVTLHLKR